MDLVKAKYIFQEEPLMRNTWDISNWWGKKNINEPQKQKGAFLCIKEFIWILRFCLHLIFYIIYLLGFTAWGASPQQHRA